MNLYDFYDRSNRINITENAPSASDVEQEYISENLHKWFKEKWVRFGPDGKIRGECARDDDSEGKPKCLPRAKAHSLGKKGRKYAASKKRREDPNPERSGKAINVATKREKTNEAPKYKHFCPECGGIAYEDEILAEKKDACYHKVKSRYKVWPSAYASGALVKCRKKGAKNWGKTKEDISEQTGPKGETIRVPPNPEAERQFQAAIDKLPRRSAADVTAPQAGSSNSTASRIASGEKISNVLQTQADKDEKQRRLDSYKADREGRLPTTPPMGSTLPTRSVSGSVVPATSAERAAAAAAASATSTASSMDPRARGLRSGGDTSVRGLVEPRRASTSRSNVPPATTTSTASGIPTAINQIIGLNRDIKNPNLIFPGQKINLPGGGTYTVARGDNLWNISRGIYRGTAPNTQATPTAGPSVVSSPSSSSTAGVASPAQQTTVSPTSTGTPVGWSTGGGMPLTTTSGAPVLTGSYRDSDTSAQTNRNLTQTQQVWANNVDLKDPAIVARMPLPKPEEIANTISKVEAGGNPNIAYGDRVDRNGNIVNPIKTADGQPLKTAEQWSAENLGGKKKLADMTANEVLQFSKYRDNAAPNTGAVGAYQFRSSTLENLLNKMNIDPNRVKFDQALQDRLYGQLMTDNGKIIQRQGIVPDKVNLYMTHLLGAGNTLNIYKDQRKDPNKLVIDTMADSYKRRNPSASEEAINRYKQNALKRNPLLSRATVGNIYNVLSQRINPPRQVKENTSDKLYFNTVGTDKKTLISEFKMNHDSRGWYLSENNTNYEKLDAIRAFGSPLSEEELNAAAFSGTAATIEVDNPISPIGSVSKSQRINKRARSK